MPIKNTLKNIFYTSLFFAIASLLGGSTYLFFDAQQETIAHLSAQVAKLREKESALKVLKGFQKETAEEVLSLKKQADIFEERVEQLFYESDTLLGKVVYDYNITDTGTYLYEISHPDLQAPSYLYGTVHVRSPEFRLPEEVQKAIEKSSILFTEVDFNEEGDFAQKSYALQDSLIAFYDGLKEKPKYTATFFEYLKKHQQDPRRRFIWLVSPTFILNGDLQYNEELLCNAFERQGKPMAGLETIEDIEELGYVGTGIDLKDIAHARRMETLGGILSQLARYEVDLLFRRKAKRKYEQAFSLNPKPQGITLDELEEDMELVYKRNQHWMSTIVEYVDKGGAFIAVGNRHLADEEGLLNLLLEEGYIIRRIKADGSFVAVTLADTDLVSVYDLQPIASPPSHKKLRNTSRKR